MKKQTLYFLILVLSVILVVCIVLASLAGGIFSLFQPEVDNPTQLQSTPSSSQSEPSAPTEPSSSVPPTTIPTQPTTAPTVPTTRPGVEYIGNLYTRAELEALDSTMITYGAGKQTDSKNRPTYASSLDKQYEKYDAHFIMPDDGKVYLTYNVTYEYEGNVQKTLDILKKKDIQAVFFIDKAFARLYPELVWQIINDGHILANHCTTHPDLPTLSIDKIAYQITDVHEYIKETFGYEMWLFRPPSGYFSEQVWAIAQSLGYRSYNWSFTYADWETAPDKQPSALDGPKDATRCLPSL